MDTDFLLTTFQRLIAALPLTLEVWALSVVLGGFVANARHRRVQES